MATKSNRGWLNSRSPLHQELDWLWEQNERRFQGGHRVLRELWRFDWETLPRGVGSSDPAVLRDGSTVPVPSLTRKTRTKDNFSETLGPLQPGEHYARRQDAAIYVNFMDAFATDVVGHLFKQAPAPDKNGLDFGTLGEVRRLQDIDQPTRAELVYYNTDGVGLDGSQWDSYWSAQFKLAMATGFRWQYVEAPPEAPGNRGREARGFRPWIVGISPRLVRNHLYINGRLEWAIVDIASRRPRVTPDGGFEGNDPVNEKLLLIRQGNSDLGSEFVEGGWWRFDRNFEILPGDAGHGTWDKVVGEIPMFPLVYDRHPEMIGRPGLTELGNAAIAAMNVGSAADFDAFDGSGSVKVLRGADPAGYNLFIRKVKAGNRYAPLPVNQETQKTPDMTDASQGVVVADVFEKRINAIFAMVDRIQGSELKSAPQSSGLAQQAGFTLGSVPRLAISAGNLETAMNTAIPLFEMRFGESNPSGSAIWTRKFEAIKLVSSAQAVLQLEAIAGVKSEELESRVILAAARDEGFVPDSAVAKTIESEIRASRQAADALTKLAAQAKAQPQAQNGANPDTPGERRRNMPPEPAQANQPNKTQLDGPNIP